MFTECGLFLPRVSVLPTLIKRDENRIFHLAAEAGEDAAGASCLNTVPHSLR